MFFNFLHLQICFQNPNDNMPRHRIISFYGFTMDYCIMDTEAVWEVKVRSIMNLNFDSFNYDLTFLFMLRWKKRNLNDDEMETFYISISYFYCFRSFFVMASSEAEERKSLLSKWHVELNRKNCNIDGISNIFSLAIFIPSTWKFSFSLECIKHKYAIFLQTLKNLKLSERNNLFLF